MSEFFLSDSIFRIKRLTCRDLNPQQGSHTFKNVKSNFRGTSNCKVVHIFRWQKGQDYEAGAKNKDGLCKKIETSLGL